MRPVELVNTVVHDNFSDFQIYEDSIPESVINDVHSTQVLLKESQSDISQFGDMTFNSMTVGVDIQIFYSVDYEEDMILTEIKLMKALENDGWSITNSQPHYIDLSQTDVQQTIKNISINKILTLEEIGYN
ncbi:DUF806 family protein [Weissella paramesenteroides]|uniref:DUF806 family protein n=1 Tax=Weissella paramesenteroides TaxID=1249 RepID=UPI003981D7AD